MLNRFRRYLIALLLILLPLGIFWQARDYDFAWDDDLHIGENPHLYQVRPATALFFWQEPYAGLYIPVTYSVLATLASFAERPANGGRSTFDPLPFHAANIVLHILNVLMVFAILRLVVDSDWAACGGALLFACHPLQVEPVAWATGMKDVLSGSLALFAVWQYLAYARERSLSSDPSQAPTLPSSTGSGLGREGDVGGSAAAAEVKKNPGSLRYWLALVAYALALLCKPAAVAVPAINLMLDWWVVRRTLRQSAVELIPWVLIAAPVIVVTKWAQPDVELDFIPPLWARFLVAADALVFYLTKLVLPLRLGADYGRIPELVLQQRAVYVTWIIPCGLAALIWFWRNRKPFLAAAAGIFVAGMLPVSGLVPFSFQAISTVADRYLYLSMLGPALAIAWVLAYYRRMSLAVGCGLLVSVLAVMSVFQVQYWRNETMLFAHALEVNPRSWISHNNIGKARFEEGKIDEAIEHYQQALLANPRFSKSHNNLGNALAAKGELEKAVESYRKALTIGPRDPTVHNNLGLVLVAQGKVEEAIEQFRQALKIDATYAGAHFNLGNALAVSGRLEQAIEHYRQTLDNDPTFAAGHVALGNALAAAGKLEQAIAHYRQALAIEPKGANAHLNLGLALAGLGQMEEAIKELRRVLELENSAGMLSQTHFSLGTIFAKQGHLDEAGKQFEQALKLNPDFARARHYMGRVLEARGELNKAIDHYQQAVRSDPELAEAHQSLGEALAKQGRRDEAIEHYQIALQILKARRKAADGH